MHSVYMRVCGVQVDCLKLIVGLPRGRNLTRHKQFQSCCTTSLSRKTKNLYPLPFVVLNTIAPSGPPGRWGGVIPTLIHTPIFLYLNCAVSEHRRYTDFRFCLPKFDKFQTWSALYWTHAGISGNGSKRQSPQTVSCYRLFDLLPQKKKQWLKTIKFNLAVYTLYILIKQPEKIWNLKVNI